MFELPTEIVIGEQSYAIRNRGDYRMVLDCFSALNDEELTENYRLSTCMIIFFDGMEEIDDLVSTFGDNMRQAINGMMNFFNCGQPESPKAKKYSLVNWEKDQQLISAAINNVTKTEVRSLEYLHWWTFMGYYMSIGESSFSTVVSIRDKIKQGKKLEKYEKEFKRDNPQYFDWEPKSKETEDLEAYIREMWDSGGE